MLDISKSSFLALSVLLVACGGDGSRARGGNTACANVATTGTDMPGPGGRGGMMGQSGHAGEGGMKQGPGMMGGGMMGGMSGGMMNEGAMMGGGRTMGGGPGGPDAHGAPRNTGPLAALSEDARKAVDAALESERKSESLYQRISEQFRRPFKAISFSEERHAWALENLYESRGLEIPKRAAETKAATFKDLKAACAAGVDSEKANIVMYDEALKKDLPPDVRRVFTHLRAASERRHLVAFQRCD